MKIIGMNVQHDGGCCLIVDGEIACAITEERLSRQRGAGGWWYSLKYCLEAAKLSLSEIDLAVFSSYGDDLPADFDGGLTAYGLRPGRSVVIDHHLSHAASAFWGSTFDKALVVVLDGIGNHSDTESYFVCDGNAIQRIGGNENRAPGRGVGKTYEAFTSFLGWQMIDSGSTMALAAYGNPDRYCGLELFEVKGDQINSALSEKYLQGVIGFAKRAGVDFGQPFDRGASQTSWDVARFVQDRTEWALVELISNLVQQTGVHKVCLAGGVALNCVSNERIRKMSGIDALFIPPFASDKGQAVGNALFGHAVIRGGGRPSPLIRDSFGRSYTQEEIEPVLRIRQELGNNFIVEAPPIEFEKIDKIEVEVAKLLQSGKTVGWVQGGSEMGPRALGHRSILADPRSADIKKHLNENVKKRAWFRPYSPSVLAESAGSYFDLNVPSPYMLLAPQVPAEKAVKIPGVVHVDNSSRPQTVSKDTEPKFHQLIKEWESLTGVPLILNTSFNLSGEPIVETPRDAVNAFLRCGLDYLVIENYLIRKKRPLWELEISTGASETNPLLCGAS